MLKCGKFARTLILAFPTMFAGVTVTSAQTDPGPRGGAANAGGAFSQLDNHTVVYFLQAMKRFQEVDSVSGTIEAGSGLGPTFNGNSCAMCHAQPAIGGSSPGLTSRQNPVPNPQVALATLDGATNTVPSFITQNGPVREARFPSDGGVHGLYTIQGRSDANGCVLAQPDFVQAAAQNNLIFRIPTPLFGLGLVENTSDASLIANLIAQSALKLQLGIGGLLNTNGNDGTVTRFGWKAQNKSLMIFAGEAYNVEQGVTNEIFPNERSTVPGCVFNGGPEDGTNLIVNGSTVGTASDMSSDTVNFAAFSRLSGPPTGTTSSVSELAGAVVFARIGCAVCHTATLTSGKSAYAGMSNVTYHPFSDFAVHHMGSGLADGVTQGNAGPDQFRTAPLWGLGQRLFFLHDGRTQDLLAAIDAHASAGVPCTPTIQAANCASEANAVISNFHQLTSQEKQQLLSFLRSL